MGWKRNRDPDSEEWPVRLVKSRYARGDLTYEDFEAAIEFVLSDGPVPAWVYGGHIPSSVAPDLTKDDYNRGRPSYEREQQQRDL